MLTAHSSYGYITNSPNDQIAKGVLPQNVICSKYLVLMKALSDNSPACVKPQTSQKLVERGWGILVTNITNEGLTPSSKYFTMDIGQPTINKTTLSYVNGSVEFVSTEEFPIIVFSPKEMNVDLKTSEVPNGIWTKFIPQQFDVGPNGTTSTMILSGAIKPFEGGSNTTVAIIANSSNGMMINETFPIVQTDNLTILGAPEPIEFSSTMVMTPYQTNFITFGAVYDPVNDLKNSSLSVNLSVLGFLEDGKILPMPSWLKIDIPVHSFMLNANQPYYSVIGGSTFSAPIGNYTIVIDEIVDRQHFTGDVKISVFQLPRTQPIG